MDERYCLSVTDIDGTVKYCIWFMGVRDFKLFCNKLKFLIDKEIAND